MIFKRFVVNCIKHMQTNLLIFVILCCAVPHSNAGNWIYNESNDKAAKAIKNAYNSTNVLELADIDESNLDNLLALELDINDSYYTALRNRKVLDIISDKESSIDSVFFSEIENKLGTLYGITIDQNSMPDRVERLGQIYEKIKNVSKNAREFRESKAKVKKINEVEIPLLEKTHNIKLPRFDGTNPLPAIAPDKDALGKPLKAEQIDDIKGKWVILSGGIALFLSKKSAPLSDRTFNDKTRIKSAYIRWVAAKESYDKFKSNAKNEALVASIELDRLSKNMVEIPIRVIGSHDDDLVAMMGATTAGVLRVSADMATASTNIIQVSKSAATTGRPLRYVEGKKVLSTEELHEWPIPVTITGYNDDLEGKVVELRHDKKSLDPALTGKFIRKRGRLLAVLKHADKTGVINALIRKPGALSVYVSGKAVSSTVAIIDREASAPKASAMDIVDLYDLIQTNSTKAIEVLDALVQVAGIFGRDEQLSKELESINTILPILASGEVPEDEVPGDLRTAAIVVSGLTRVLKRLDEWESVEKYDLLIRQEMIEARQDAAKSFLKLRKSAVSFSEMEYLAVKEEGEYLLDIARLAINLKDGLAEAGTDLTNRIADIDKDLSDPKITEKERGRLVEQRRAYGKELKILEQGLDGVTTRSLLSDITFSRDVKRYAYEAVAAYANVFGIAKTAEEAARIRRRYLSYREVTVSSRTSLAMWNALIQIPVHQLSDYYAGGLKPEVLAETLSNLIGLGLIGWGIKESD